MKKVKGVAALTAALITANSAAMVWAAETGTKGQGTFEGNVSMNIYNVVLPTINEDNNGFASQLSFIIDPNDLITKSKNSRYSAENENIVFESGKGFYFKNADGNYSAKSDDLTAVNKSSTKIDVTLQASLSNYNGISLQGGDSTSNEVFGTSKSPSICINLKSGDKSSAITEESNAELKDRIDGADESAFVLLYDQSTGYKYSQSSLASEEAFKEYTFWFTGASNMNGNWEGISDDTAPVLDLVWRFDQYLGDIAPSVNESTLALSLEEDAMINFDFGTGDYAATDVTAISIIDSGNTNANALQLVSSGYAVVDLENKQIRFKKSLANVLSEAGVTTGKIKVVFNNNKESSGDYPTEITIPFTVS